MRHAGRRRSNVPTTDALPSGIGDPESLHPGRDAGADAAEFRVEYYDERDRRQGIRSMVSDPNRGLTLAATTIVLRRQPHFATAGSEMALAQVTTIGTSEVEQ